LCESDGGKVSTLVGSTSRVLDEQTFAFLFGTTTEDVATKCGAVIRESNFAYDVLDGSERESVFLRVMISKQEACNEIDEIQYPAVREVYRFMDVRGGLVITA
jgi:hypothetical protein